MIATDTRENLKSGCCSAAVYCYRFNPVGLFHYCEQCNRVIDDFTLNPENPIRIAQEVIRKWDPENTGALIKR